MEPVRNSKNPKVVEAARLHRARDRKQTGTTLIEGPHLLEEAIEAGSDIRAIFSLESDTTTHDVARQLGLTALLVDESGLKRLSGTETPRGPIAVVGIPQEVETRHQHLLVSWGVSDPGNVGTMIRVARTFGWAFGYTEGTSDPWSPKALRAAAGNQFSTAISKIDDFASLRGRGFRTLAAIVEGGAAPDVVTGRCALLIGEEAGGLPEEIVAACDGTLTVPMAGGADSLNAAVAAGILTYAIGNASQPPKASLSPKSRHRV